MGQVGNGLFHLTDELFEGNIYFLFYRLLCFTANNASYQARLLFSLSLFFMIYIFFFFFQLRSASEGIISGHYIGCRGSGDHKTTILTNKPKRKRENLL